MSSSYDRSRSPVRRSDSGKYSNSSRYDRRDRRYDDYNNKSSSRRDRDEDNDRRRDYDKSRYDRRQQPEKQTIPEEDIKMESCDTTPSLKKRVPISIEELIQKKEQEQKEIEKVSTRRKIK